VCFVIGVTRGGRKGEGEGVRVYTESKRWKGYVALDKAQMRVAQQVETNVYEAVKA
jgi:hypothetical protein